MKRPVPGVKARHSCYNKFHLDGDCSAKPIDLYFSFHAEDTYLKC